jgi:hypothetical protein
VTVVISNVYVRACVCVRVYEILNIRHELDAKFRLILYQRKTRESAEVQTFPQTHISYTRSASIWYREFQ